MIYLQQSARANLRWHIFYLVNFLQRLYLFIAKLASLQKNIKTVAMGSKTRPSKQCEFYIYFHDQFFNHLGLPECLSWSGWSVSQVGQVCLVVYVVQVVQVGRGVQVVQVIRVTRVVRVVQVIKFVNVVQVVQVVRVVRGFQVV